MFVRMPSLLAVGAALLLFGCAPIAKRVPAPESSTTAATQADGIVVPLDEYELSQVQQIKYDTAVDLRGRVCMRSFGVEYTIPDRRYDNEVEAKNARRFGLVDERHASTWGYHLTGSERSRTERIRRASQSMPTHVLQLWVGEIKTFNEVISAR